MVAHRTGWLTSLIKQRMWSGRIARARRGELSEAAILGLAASLATATPVVLRHAITGLDQTNLYLVINAVRDAGGHK